MSSLSGIVDCIMCAITEFPRTATLHTFPKRCSLGQTMNCGIEEEWKKKEELIR